MEMEHLSDGKGQCSAINYNAELKWRREQHYWSTLECCLDHYHCLIDPASRPAIDTTHLSRVSPYYPLLLLLLLYFSCSVPHLERRLLDGQDTAARASDTLPCNRAKERRMVHQYWRG